MAGVWHDLRWAAAALRRAPGVTAVAVATLALGIGMATAVFSAVNAVLLRPLPYPGADRLVRIWEEQPGGVSPAGNRWLSSHTHAAWREGARTLEGVGAFGLYEYTMRFGTGAEKVYGSPISAIVFDLLGVDTARGRWFDAAEDVDGHDRVVVLSDPLWRERFGARPDVLGATLAIDGVPRTIVGIAPAGFQFPDPRARFWIPHPLPLEAPASARTVVFSAIGRLRAGSTPAQAEAEGTAVARSAPRHPLTTFFFGQGGDVVVRARPLGDDLARPVRPALSMLAGAVGLVLLIACGNVANLLLSRGTARQRELAVRAALGASRGRLIRQLLAESTLLSIVGGGLGVLVAWWLLVLLPALAPPRVLRLEEVGVDLSLLAIAAAATLLAAMAAGVVPAVRGAGLDLFEACRSGVGGSGSDGRGPHGKRLRGGLLVVEAAFAAMLMVGAGLLVHSFVRLVGVDAGYSAERVLTARIELLGEVSDERTDQLITGVLARVRALPGVVAAGAGNMIPLMLRTAISPFTVPPSLAGGKPSSGRALAYWVTPGYAEALDLRLRDGRFLSADDGRAGRVAVMVNQEFVRRHLAVPRAVGLVFPNPRGAGEPDVEIVGVVGDVLKDGNEQEPQPEWYFAHGPNGYRLSGQAQIVVRVERDPEALAPVLRRIVHDVDPGALADRMVPLTTVVAASMDRPRFAATVVAGLAGLALALVAMGFYGVLSYGVSQRQRELGVRAALGAGRGDLAWLLLREGLALTIGGLLLGLAAAAVFARVLRALLFGVAPLDAASFIVGPLVLLLVALAACLLPAWRAAVTDPAVALRQN